MDRSAQVENKGYSFDFHVLDKYAKKSQTPATPIISLINALNVQMDRILDEVRKIYILPRQMGTDFRKYRVPREDQSEGEEE